MKKIIFLLFVMLTFNNNAQLKFPKEFPNKLKNKVICGTASTDGKMLNGSTTFLDFPYKLTISDDGIFAEYNPREKFGDDDWGQTQTIKVLTEWKRVPFYNQYDELIGYVIHYKVPNAYQNNLGEWGKHSINEIKIETRLDGSSILIIHLSVPSYKSASISSNHVQKYFSICGTVLSKEERLKQELQQKEIDKVTLLKINECLTKNNINEAFQMYQKLTNKDEELLKKINQKISYNEYKVKEFLSEKNIDSAIHYYSKNPPSQNIK